jgi:hypothetical protein
MQKWEYKTIVSAYGGPNTDTDKKLNEMAADGWELFSVNPASGTNFLYVFKRPKQ